jgi:PEP-CTERM motif
MKMKTTLGICLVALLFATSAFAISDDFESYTLGDPAPAPWNTFGSQNVVTDMFANSGTQSVNIAGATTGILGTDVAFDPTANIKLSYRENTGYMSFFVYISNGGGDVEQGIGNQLYTRILVDYWFGIVSSWPGTTTWLTTPKILEGGNADGMSVGMWHDLEIQLDLPNGTFDVSFNGNLVGDDIAMWYTGGAPVDGTILRVYLQSTKTGADGTFIDDFSITAIPEPASMGLIGLVALGLLRKRG